MTTTTTFTARPQADYLNEDRVRRKTRPRAIEAIDRKTRGNVRYYAAQPRHRLDEHIAELERERDMEQVLETNAGILAFTGAVLGTTVHRGFFALTGTVLGFLTQHAITGWCPPVPIFRATGVRTRAEINQERFALKALRGDFRGVKEEDGRISLTRVTEAVNT